MPSFRLVTPRGSVTGHALDQAALFLRGGNDWQCQYPAGRATRYEGWFLGDSSTQPHRYFKFLERVEILAEGAVPRQITRSPEALLYQFFGEAEVAQVLADGAMLYRGNQPFSIQLNLDMRGIYLQPDQGREYTFQADATGLLISYTDPTLEGRNLFLHARAKDGHGLPLLHWPKKGTWELVSYPRDAARHSHPTESYIFSLEALTLQELALGIGFTKEEAVAASERATKLNFPTFKDLPTISEAEAAVALTEVAMQNLRTSEGYYAGFPWFHQFWSRDELLTGLGLPEAEQLAMIERYAQLPLVNGELPTYAGSGTTCADGLGWLALLAREYGLEKLPAELRDMLKKRFSEGVIGLNESRRTPSGLVWSGHNATWMDTIGRVGCRIEIQCMYALILELAGQPEDQQATLENIKHTLFQNGYLADGLDENLQLDARKRPNVFLAYLLQPNLLSHDEWVSCFDNILAATLTEWDGLSSLDQADPAFQATSTGETNESYHNGDSWFFVNNLAALALRRLDTPHYKATIEALTESSVREILWQNFLGCPGEIASASDGESWGCGIQGFSGGAFLKLLQESNRK